MKVSSKSKHHVEQDLHGFQEFLRRQLFIDLDLRRLVVRASVLRKLVLASHLVDDEVEFFPTYLY